MENLVDKELCKKVSAEIQAAILPILAKHGMTLSKQSSTYGDTYAIKITAVTTNLGDGGVNLNSAEATLYQRYGHYGFVNGESLKLTAKLGAKFDSRGRKFVFSGVRSRGKNRIVAKCEQDGKDYVFADTVIPILNKVA